jgi:hypothetical protein
MVVCRGGDEEGRVGFNGCAHPRCGMCGEEVGLRAVLGLFLLALVGGLLTGCLVGRGGGGYGVKKGGWLALTRERGPEGKRSSEYLDDIRGSDEKSAI